MHVIIALVACVTILRKHDSFGLIFTTEDFYHCVSIAANK